MKRASDHPLRPGAVVELSTGLATPSPYYLGYGIAEALCARLAEMTFDRLILVTERNIYGPYGRDLHALLSRHFRCELHFVESGEAAKRFSALEELCEALLALGASKSTVSLAFGGGSVGNLVGLAASLIYRGIRFVEIPTTMTGQTDSTLSNKQAVNGRGGKNLFGLYSAPVWIWSDVAYLRTEPLTSKKSGVVEGIKNGLVSNPALLDQLMPLVSPSMTLDAEQEWALVCRIFDSKLDIIREDPGEKGYGLVLEYGHTFGHAIEWLAKGELLHGEAVAVGMRMAAHLSQALDMLGPEDIALHEYLLGERLGVNPRLPDTVDADALVRVMAADNKRVGEHPRFVLLERIGRCFNPEGDYLVSVGRGQVSRLLEDFLAAWDARAFDDGGAPCSAP